MTAKEHAALLVRQFIKKHSLAEACRVTGLSKNTLKSIQNPDVSNFKKTLYLALRKLYSIDVADSWWNEYFEGEQNDIKGMESAHEGLKESHVSFDHYRDYQRRHIYMVGESIGGIDPDEYLNRHPHQKKTLNSMIESGELYENESDSMSAVHHDIEGFTRARDSVDAMLQALKLFEDDTCASIGLGNERINIDAFTKCMRLILETRKAMRRLISEGRDPNGVHFAWMIFGSSFNLPEDDTLELKKIVNTFLERKSHE